LFRICPGRYFADAKLWNAIAFILATVEIVPERDEMGNPQIPELEFIEGLVRCAGILCSGLLVTTDLQIGSEPAPFECNIRPRAEAQALLAQIEEA